jgi:hypothetical protein
MKGTNVIAVGLVLSSFALLGTWAGTTGNVRVTDEALISNTANQSKCPYEDQSSGLGGQSGECVFACRGGVTGLGVTADDDGAGVSGTGYCNEQGVLHCSGEGSCEDSIASVREGEGRCSGDSDEFYDSGLYVSCASESDLHQPDPGNIGPEPICIATIEPSPPFPRICVGGDGGDGDAGAAMGSLPLNACRIAGRNGTLLCDEVRDPEEIVGAIQNMTAFILEKFNGTENAVSAHIFSVDGYATGLVCWGFDCKHVLPSFDVPGPGRVRWSVQ